MQEHWCYLVDRLPFGSIVTGTIEEAAPHDQPNDDKKGVGKDIE